MSNRDLDYSNPYHLHYYLIKGSDAKLNVNIVKRKQIETKSGNLEFAVIGSSHYIKLDNKFTELLSCTFEDVEKGLILRKQNSDFFKFSYDFEDFKYSINVVTETQSTETEFFNAERSISKQNTDLHHFFGNNTSLTALKLSIDDDNYYIETWHSYPEHLKIVHSVTTLCML